MPWPVKPEMSMVCGWVFLSAAWSFAFYLLALAVTATVSLYYLFVCRATRFRARKGEGQA
jgi:hypothetical protein